MDFNKTISDLKRKKWAADLLEKFQSLNGVPQHYQDVTWIPSEKWPSWRDWDVVCLAHTQSFVFKKNWRRPKDGSKMTDLSLTCTHNSDWAAHRNRTGLNDTLLIRHAHWDRCPKNVSSSRSLWYTEMIFWNKIGRTFYFMKPFFKNLIMSKAM